MPWRELWFGKHKGKTLPQVIFSDPDWFYWAIDEGVFKVKKKIRREAEEIYRKSIKIKIPNNKKGRLVVEYAIHPPTGKFGHMEIIPASIPKHSGATDTFRSDYIDLSIPRKIAPYDKLGCKNLISDFKHCYFGSNKHKMTKKRCEEFFANNDNFEL